MEPVPQPPLTGDVQHHELWCESLQRSIPIHLRLPAGYGDSQERYPVIYMFDGHNLFLDSEATYGKSWNLDAFLGQYDKPFIIVGLECDHRGNSRLNEYAPWDNPRTPMGPIEGKGELLFDWIIRELKPVIDQNYRTWPQREATAVAGSSMGGLMAYYGVLKHNDVFSKAAALSPSLFLYPGPLHELINSADLNPDTRLYMSMGSTELRRNRRRIWQLLQGFSKPLNRKDIMTHINYVKGGRHHEASWEKESPEWFDFLWK